MIADEAWVPKSPIFQLFTSLSKKDLLESGILEAHSPATFVGLQLVFKC